MNYKIRSFVKYFILVFCCMLVVEGPLPSNEVVQIIEMSEKKI